MSSNPDSRFDSRPRAPRDDRWVAESAVGWARDAGVVDEVLDHLNMELRRARARRLGMAGGVAVVLLAATAVWRFSDTGSARQVANPAAGQGATVVVSMPVSRVLADGSILLLQDDAEVDVAFDAATRRVLLRRGEVHCDVAKDPARPFIVAARGVEARAVGTAFSVQLGGSGVEVLVSEGRVAVERESATTPATAVGAPVAEPAPAPRMLEAGTRVVVPLAGPAQEIPEVETVSALEMVERLAWRTPLLDFSAAPLTEVVAQFNRHGDQRIVIGDERLGQLQVSGSMRASRADVLMKLLQVEFGVRVERLPDGNLLLHAD